MLTTVTRKSIFESSIFVDNYIAEIQQSYAANFDNNNLQDAATKKTYYDHLKPFKPNNSKFNKMGVIAFSAKNKTDYQINFPLQLQQLLLKLDIRDLWLMQFLQTNLVHDFPFENLAKRNLFKRFGGKNKSNLGYHFSTNDLTNILPIFLLSKQYDIPVILLFAVNHSLALRLCDDGNFHFEIGDNLCHQFSTIATNYHLIVDNENICNRCSVFYFNKAKEQGNLLTFENA